MSDDMPQYGVPEDDQRTLRQAMRERPMNAWEKFACCCGCFLLIPVPMALFGLLFL